MNLRWRKKRVPQRHPLPGWPAGAAFPDSLSDDLMKHLFESVYAVDLGARHLSRWVMTAEWFSECRKMTDPAGRSVLMPSMTVDSHDCLLGLPVKIRDGSGPPHLEPRP